MTKAARFDLPLAARSAWVTLAARSGGMLKGDRLDRYAPLAPVVLASLGDAPRSESELERWSKACVVSRALMLLDHRDMMRGGRCHEVRNGDAVRRASARGGVLVGSLHLGAYFYVISEVADLGGPVRAFSTASMAALWGPGGDALAARRNVDLALIDPEQPSGILRALRDLKRGASIVAYLDGQFGADGIASREHGADVPFLSRHVRTRFGPAFLSHRAQVPIVLAAVTREGLSRRVIEFSDPIPPPRDVTVEALAAHMAALFAWFEPHVRRHPDQWSSWFSLPLMWPEMGRAPTATRTEFERERERIAGVIAARDRRAVLTADAHRVGAFEVDGEWMILDGGQRRVLKASRRSCRVLEAALRGTRIVDLPRRLGLDVATVGLEVTRLTLAGLARVDVRR